MSHSSLLLLSMGWSVVFAQTAPDLAIEITQEAGHSKFVFRNVYRVPVQAYAIDLRDTLAPQQSQCFVYNVLIEGTRRIETNGTTEVPLPDVHTLVRIAVVYADGAMAGNPEVLRQLIDIRAAVRRSIPFAVIDKRHGWTNLRHPASLEKKDCWTFRRDHVTIGSHGRLPWS
ncbi:MAG: hypothetical protein DMG57_18585 [Acidobacteria bacterium]|nr:MAG: hypothetical protein DMG57_18585 [Acidobacteriota bacterium]